MSHAASPLADALRDAGWGPRDLARAVNDRLRDKGREKHAIHATTAYSWVKRGFCPYQPVADTAAEVLSETLGRSVTTADLWPGRVDLTASPGTAADNLPSNWDAAGAAEQLGELSRMSPAVTMALRASAGPELVNAATDGLLHRPPRLGPASGAADFPAALVSLLARHTDDLRELDYRHGGGSLGRRYAAAELLSLLDGMRGAGYSEAMGVRLHVTAAELAKVTGWMHFDAGAFGAAQRYLLLAVRMARAADDSACAADGAGMLAYLAAYLGQGQEAVRLATAADALAENTEHHTRARTAGRLATAYAAAGDMAAFRLHAERAKQLYEARRAESPPPALFYLSDEQLDAEAGQSLVTLARGRDRRSRRLIDEAVDLLTPMSQSALEDRLRAVLLHTCYLALAHTRRGDVGGACTYGRLAVSRMADVQSQRCHVLLTRLARELRTAGSDPDVAGFLRELRAVVPGARDD